MSSALLALDTLLVGGLVLASVAVIVAVARRLPRSDPRPKATERPAGQSDRSAEADSIERNIDHEPSVVFAALRMAATSVGLPPRPGAPGAASASKADIANLLDELEVHLGLKGRPDQ